MSFSDNLSTFSSPAPKAMVSELSIQYIMNSVFLKERMLRSINEIHHQVIGPQNEEIEKTSLKQVEDLG